MTYLVNAIIASGVSGRDVNCSENELSVFTVPNEYGTCGTYMATYLNAAGSSAGRLLNPESTDQCRYCTLASADQYLESMDIFYDQRWRNFGLLWVYVLFNVGFTFGVYYFGRVRVWKRR